MNEYRMYSMRLMMKTTSFYDLQILTYFYISVLQVVPGLEIHGTDIIPGGDTRKSFSLRNPVVGKRRLIAGIESLHPNLKLPAIALGNLESVRPRGNLI